METFTELTMRDFIVSIAKSIRWSFPFEVVSLVVATILIFDVLIFFFISYVGY